MKYTFSIILFFFCFTLTYGQNFQKAFNRAIGEGDTIKQRETLQEWEKETPEDAELFTSYFNYYFLQSKKEVLALTMDQPEGESLGISDSSGNSAGFIGSQIMHLEEPFEKAMNKIDQGIKLFPNRLDMRFGKIYALGQYGDWDRFTDEIVKTVRFSKDNNNQWTWANNKKKEDGEAFFLSSLQNYQLTLYNTGEEKLLLNMRTIAQEVLKIYPDNIENLSNLSITYLLTGEYDQAIEALLKAEKLAPTDGVVLGNIAQGYKLKGDKKMAIKYYKKVRKYGDEEAIAFAEQQIEELKK